MHPGLSFLQLTGLARRQDAVPCSRPSQRPFSPSAASVVSLSCSVYLVSVIVSFRYISPVTVAAALFQYYSAFPSKLRAPNQARDLPPPAIVFHPANFCYFCYFFTSFLLDIYNFFSFCSSSSSVQAILLV